MPTYEYACTSCAHEWEFEQSIKDSALTKCPSCSNETARRQISRGTGFILKGSGWYSDLYSSSSNKPPAKADGGGTASSGTESKSSDSGSSGTADAGGGAKADAGSGAKADAGGGTKADGGGKSESGSSPATSAA